MEVRKYSESYFLIVFSGIYWQLQWNNKTSDLCFNCLSHQLHEKRCLFSLSLSTCVCFLSAHDDAIWTAAWGKSEADVTETIVTGSLDDMVKVWKWWAFLTFLLVTIPWFIQPLAGYTVTWFMNIALVFFFLILIFASFYSSSFLWSMIKIFTNNENDQYEWQIKKQETNIRKTFWKSSSVWSDKIWCVCCLIPHQQSCLTEPDCVIQLQGQWGDCLRPQLETSRAHLFVSLLLSKKVFCSDWHLNMAMCI